MTNKTERFLVMSEAEFEAALKAVRTTESMCSDSGVRDERFELLAEVAEAACRARPVKPLHNFHGEITQWVDEND